MKVLLNGAEAELDDGATVAAALESLALPAAGRGVAVAVDAEVVPRGEWSATDTHSSSFRPSNSTIASEGAAASLAPGVTMGGTGEYTSVSSCFGAGALL